jgi:hypothetical protein
MLTAVFKWQGPDSTRDLNDKTKALFSKGVLSDGLLVPVSGQLQVTVQAFTAVSNDGMLVVEDAGSVLTIPAGQTTIVSVLAKHNIGADPTLSYGVHEASVYAALSDINDRIILGQITLTLGATQVTTGDISYVNRDIQEKVTRLRFRGRVADSSSLPAASSTLNRAGDCYVITAGTGDNPTIWSWNGSAWVNLTTSVTLAAELAQHRANMFPDEVHLTNAQALAALGTSGTPGAGNKYVTDSDTRIPTQTENDALVGTHGTPGTSNPFVTAEFPLAAAEILTYPVAPGGSVEVNSANGPFFVGSGAVGSANKYFGFLHSTDKRGYLNSTNVAPQVTGVFKDAVLTVPLDPSADADSDGFFTNTLYLQLSSVIDSGFRLVYAKRYTMATLPAGLGAEINPGDEFVPSEVAEALVAITGRPYGTAPLTRERLTSLRSALDNLESYVGTVLETNVVATDEDFTKLADEPFIGTTFVKNVGVDPVYTFTNTGVVDFDYDPTLGRITFDSAVNLSSVVAGNLFRDGASRYYKITAVNDASDYLDIVDLDTGVAPAFGTVTDSAGTSVDGSCQVNFNPRGLLLSEMKTSVGSEVVRINKLQIKPNEYSRPDGLVAWGIKSADDRFDQRIVFYGSWENYPTDDSPKSFVRNRGASGRIELTGFYTTISLLVRRRAGGPSLSVSVDGAAATTVPTSASGAVSSAVGAMADAKYHRVLVASGLSSSRPSHITISIAAATAEPLEIYGLELSRDNSPSLALLESGRAFDAAQILSRDTINAAVPVPLIGTARGGRAVVALAAGSHTVGIGTVTSIPDVTATGSGTSLTVPSNSMSLYRAADLVYCQDSAVAPTVVEIRQIQSLTPTGAVLSSATSITNPVIRHLASTGVSYPFSSDEQEIARYSLLRDFTNGTDGDFEASPSGNRYVLHKDGLTIVSGQSLSRVSTGLNGSPEAVRIESGGQIRFTVLATRLDIITANDSNATSVNVFVDGSPAVTSTFTGGATRRRTIFANSRYQSHEVVISGGGGNLAITDIILFGPKKPTISGFPPESGDLSRVAAYEPSTDALTASPFVYPKGGVFHDAVAHIAYVHGTGANTDWTVENNYSASPNGKFIYSANEAAYAEFYFLGDSFELQYVTGPDHGIFKITVGGVALESVGGTIVGDYTNDEVDAYSAVYGRKNIGVYGLSYSYHLVRMQIQDPRTKNASSSDYRMAFVGYYVTNNHGYLTCGVNREGAYTSVADARVFLANALPAATKPSALDADRRAGIVNLTNGSSSITVTFPVPMPDANYVVTCNFVNYVDSDPDYQPILISNQSATGFTAKWNYPLETGNMRLGYVAEVLS